MKFTYRANHLRVTEFATVTVLTGNPHFRFPSTPSKLSPIASRNYTLPYQGPK